MTSTTSPPAVGFAPTDTTWIATWQRRALVLGGLLFAVGNGLHPLEHTDAAYRSATWEAAHLVILVSVPLLVAGLPLLYGAVRPHVSHRVAAAVVAATCAGFIGLAPGMVVEAFVAPSVGLEAMEDLEAGGMGVVGGLFAVGYLGGLLGVAWATRKAGLRPRWAPPVLFVATAVLIVAMGLTGPVAGAVIISGTAAEGLALAALGRALPVARA